MATRDTLCAISPLDGRYGSKVEDLRDVFSEYGLVKRRVAVECAWLAALAAHPGLPECPALSDAEAAQLRALAEGFSVADAQRVKDIEKTTNHDVKAVEYFIKEKIAGTSLAGRSEFVHFACTSEDINNMSHALMLRDGLAVLRAAQNAVTDKIAEMAHAFAAVPMLAHTHGQPASPTTLGKELAVVAARLRRQQDELDRIVLPAKMNGAVGNFNAHLAAFPHIDWRDFAGSFLADDLGIKREALTTQISNYDNLAALFDALRRINTIILDLDRDMWMYISAEYFKQKIRPGEVGSSAMPHKVNPIDFENSEGNIGLADAIYAHLAAKLPVSRLQRDLTDSTVLRNVGVPMAHSLIAIASTCKGLDKLVLNRTAIDADLQGMWNVVAEAIQTILRREAYPNPYETLKALTRKNTAVTSETIAEFIDSLDVSPEVRAQLHAITPSTYTGY